MHEIKPAGFGDAICAVQGNSLAFPDPHDLARKFSIRDFHDLCVALEAAVLHDTLLRPEFDPDEALFPTVFHPLCRQLTDAGVLLFGPDLPDELVRSTRRYREFVEVQVALAEKGRFGTLLDEGRLGPQVAFEELYRVPLVLSPRSLPVYLAMPDVRRDARVVHNLRVSLGEVYADFANALLDLRRMADGENNLLVPPIALEVLSIASELDDIGPALLDMRERFSGVRRRFREINEVLQSPDVRLGKKLREQLKMQKSLNVLLSKEEKHMAIACRDPMTVMTSVGRTVGDVVKLEGLANGPDLSDVSWGKLVGFALGSLESGVLKLRLRPLHATKRRYLDTPGGAAATIVKRLFGKELRADDLAQDKAEMSELEHGMNDLFQSATRAEGP